MQHLRDQYSSMQFLRKKKSSFQCLRLAKLNSLSFEMTFNQKDDVQNFSTNLIKLDFNLI